MIAIADLRPATASRKSRPLPRALTNRPNRTPCCRSWSVRYGKNACQVWSSWAGAQASPSTSAASQETQIVPTVMRQDELQPKSRGARVGALKERWDPFSRWQVDATKFRPARRFSARGRWLVKRPPLRPRHIRGLTVSIGLRNSAPIVAATFSRARIARTPKLFVRLRPSALRPHCRSDRAKP
jgi:hypothetical protein